MVTAFNSVQYANDPVAAVTNMSQVVRPGGLISLLVWGPPERVQSGVMFAELGPLMPPSPPAAPGSPRVERGGAALESPVSPRSPSRTCPTR